MYCIYLACRMHVFDRAIVVVTSVRYLNFLRYGVPSAAIQGGPEALLFYSIP